MTVRHLTLSWSVSRGRETYGYNICRLRDDGTGKTYRCMGGGYDMQGTVFGEWLQAEYQDKLQEIADRNHAYYRHVSGLGWVKRHDKSAEDLYGMTVREHPSGDVYTALDGACGLESMERIAKAIGLKVKHIVDRKGHITAFLVATEGEEL